MPSHLSGAFRELAVEIMRCPVLSQCLTEGGQVLPCHQVVTGPGGPKHSHWVPDPWMGHLTEAPLLFVSSNPGSGGDPSCDPEDLSGASDDESLLDFEDGAFDLGQFPGIADGAHLVDRLGNRGPWVHYWGWVKDRATEVLPQPVIPGQAYALTEVVHCGTTGEDGVWAALETCATRYLQRVLRASPAMVVVVVGSVARFAFQKYLDPAAPDHLLGPVELAGRERLVLVVPHPNSRGGNVPLGRHLSEEQLAKVRQVLTG